MGIFRRFLPSRNLSLDSRKLVVITGCDHGLGFNIAKLCHSLGLTVIAGCLSKTSSGAQYLSKLQPKISVESLDLTVPESIQDMRSQVQETLSSNKDSEFYALVNNAGFMAFGEFEWLTSTLLQRHINVNLLGTMNLTHSLLPIIRDSSQRLGNASGARIINVTSHCSLVALPGLSVYAASKAGLSFYTSALQIELKKYNIRVVNFIPGSFVMQSGLLKRQKEFGSEMWAAMGEEQKHFYGEYFKKYNDYIGTVSDFVPKDAVEVDPEIIGAFRDALTLKNPKRRYIVEPMRYKIYHKLFDILPDCETRDRLIQRFMKMPKYKTPQVS